MTLPVFPRACFTRSVLGVFFCLLLSVWASLSFAQDEDVASFKFDHFKTGFALEGMHAEIECESCHTRGVFKGTPSKCVDCHAEGSPVNASAKPIHHILSLDTCDDCHTSDEWTFVARVDHAATLGDCQFCHNNFLATGLPNRHPDVGVKAYCDDCHITAEWVTYRFEHSLPSVERQQCVACHSLAGGYTAKPPVPIQHPESSDTCDNCHSTAYWKPVAFFDHGDSVVASRQCFTCHNNQPNTLAWNAVGQHDNHIPVPETSDCSACHSTNQWKLFSAMQVNHSEISAECSRCHIENSPYQISFGVISHKEQAASWHNNTTNNCEGCHQGAGISWIIPGDCKISQAQHTLDFMIAPTACQNCHMEVGYPGPFIEAATRCL